MYGVDHPTNDRWGILPARPALAFPPSWSDVAGRPAAAFREKLPSAVIVAGEAGIVAASDVAIAVARDDVEMPILLIRIEYAAEARCVAIAAITTSVRE